MNATRFQSNQPSENLMTVSTIFNFTTLVYLCYFHFYALTKTNGNKKKWDNFYPKTKFLKNMKRYYFKDMN